MAVGSGRVCEVSEQTSKAAADAGKLLCRVEQLDPVGAKYSWVVREGVLMVMRKEVVLGIPLADGDDSYEIYARLREALRGLVEDRIKAIEAEVQALDERARAAVESAAFGRMILPNAETLAEIRKECKG